MAIIREQIDTTLPLDRGVCLRRRLQQRRAWDPGVITSERLNPGPVGIGARYRLGVRLRGKAVPMEYEIAVFEPSRRVVLKGTGSGVSAVDDIRFEASGTGTRIDYVADIRLLGFMRLAAPFAGGAFARIARDARDGMQRTLDQLAAGA